MKLWPSVLYAVLIEVAYFHFKTSGICIVFPRDSKYLMRKKYIVWPDFILSGIGWIVKGESSHIYLNSALYNTENKC